MITTMIVPASCLCLGILLGFAFAHRQTSSENPKLIPDIPAANPARAQPDNAVTTDDEYDVLGPGEVGADNQPPAQPSSVPHAELRSSGCAFAESNSCFCWVQQRRVRGRAYFVADHGNGSKVHRSQACAGFNNRKLIACAKCNQF
jgi:hypothetical protein